MDKNMVIAIVLGALVLIAGIQAFQLYSFKTSLANGQLSTSTPTQAGASSSGSPALPSNLENLPTMVGGC